MSKFYDHTKLIGQRFNRLIIRAVAGKIKGHIYYDCLCDCGTQTRVPKTSLVSEHIKSCGCLKREIDEASLICPTKKCRRETPSPELCSFCKEHKYTVEKASRQKMMSNPDRIKKYHARRAASYQKNIFAYRAYSYKQDRTPCSRYNATKYSAKRRGLPFTLTKVEYYPFLDKLCFYCEDFFNAKVEVGAGLDRIDNTKGYELTNILPCCTTCNMIRGDNLTVDETRIAVQAVIAYRKLLPSTPISSG